MEGASRLERGAQTEGRRGRMCGGVSAGGLLPPNKRPRTKGCYLFGASELANEGGALRFRLPRAAF